MRNLREFGERCIDELNAIGIYPNVIVEWKVNTRAVHRFGQCCKKDGKYYININATLLDERVSENSLRETIYHELCHAVDGCMNHGSKWKSLADLVSDCYNVDITRCSSYESKYGTEVANEIIAKNKADFKRFECVCNKCGKTHWKVGKRAPKWYTHPQNYHCSCGGKLFNL